jgi:hypothetical protein
MAMISASARKAGRARSCDFTPRTQPSLPIDSAPNLTRFDGLEWTLQPSASQPAGPLQATCAPGKLVQGLDRPRGSLTRFHIPATNGRGWMGPNHGDQARRCGAFSLESCSFNDRTKWHVGRRNGLEIKGSCDAAVLQ